MNVHNHKDVNRRLYFIGKMNVRVTKGVSEELLQYYENMTTAILGNDEALVKVVMFSIKVICGKCCVHFRYKFLFYIFDYI